MSLRNPAHTALTGKTLAGIAPGRPAGKATHPVSLTRVRGSDSGPASDRTTFPYILTELGAVITDENDSGLQTEG